MNILDCWVDKRLPSLLKLGEEKSESVASKKELEQLRKQNFELRETLKIKDGEISSSRRYFGARLKLYLVFMMEFFAQSEL
jgi:hypothetical protein